MYHIVNLNTYSIVSTWNSRTAADHAVTNRDHVVWSQGQLEQRLNVQPEGIAGIVGKTTIYNTCGRPQEVTI